MGWRYGQPAYRSPPFRCWCPGAACPADHDSGAAADPDPEQSRMPEPADHDSGAAADPEPTGEPHAPQQGMPGGCPTGRATRTTSRLHRTSRHVRHGLGSARWRATRGHLPTGTRGSDWGETNPIGPRRCARRGSRSDHPLPPVIPPVPGLHGRGPAPDRFPPSWFPRGERPANPSQTESRAGGSTY